jgi:tetratricopeptide (TPR) repeat protein
VAAASVALGLTGCLSPAPPIQVEHAQTGETIVRIRQPESWEEVAERLYGSAEPAEDLARLAGLPADEPAPRGTLLVAPAREELVTRIRRAETARAAFEAGLAAARQGDDLRASERFREALELEPGRDDVRYNLGLALLNAGRPAEALPHLEEVARHRPDDAKSRYAFGSALRRLRAFERAKREFEAALDLEPDDVATRYALARTLQDLGRTEDAIRLYREIQREHPDDPLADAAADWLRSATEEAAGPAVTPQP